MARIENNSHQVIGVAMEDVEGMLKLEEEIVENQADAMHEETNLTEEPQRQSMSQNRIEPSTEPTGMTRVLNMHENAFEIEVDDKFIGAVYGDESLMRMNFQVAGVKKALAAVSKLCKAGNLVQFGSKAEECFIMNKLSKTKVVLVQKRGSYMVGVDFVKKMPDGKYETVGSEVITIDSGAEESV